MITTAVTALVLTPVVDLDGLTAITLLVRFAPVSGGTTCKAWVQTSLDQGQTWADIFCAAFTTTAGLNRQQPVGPDATHHRAGADRCCAGRRHGGGRRAGRSAALEDHVHRHLRGQARRDLRPGSVSMTPERITALIAQFGQPVTLAATGHNHPGTS